MTTPSATGPTTPTPNLTPADGEVDIDDTYLDVNEMGGAGAVPGVDLKGDLLSDNTANETYFGAVPPKTKVDAVVDDQIHLTAIRQYHVAEAMEMHALRVDPSAELVNGPGRPPWFEKCAKMALESISIDNVVVVAYLNMAIQCADVVARAALYGMKHNPSTFAAIIARMLNPLGDVEDPELPCDMPASERPQVSSTSLIFPGGKITTTGSPTFATGVMATKRVVDIIANVRDDYGRPLYPGLAIRLIGRKNVVASTALFFQLRIHDLQRKYPSFVSSVPGQWVGVVIQMSAMCPQYADRTLTILAFENGSLVFTATRGRADVERCFRVIYPILVEFAVPGTELSRADLHNEKKASKRDAAASAAARAAAAARSFVAPIAAPDVDRKVIEHIKAVAETRVASVETSVASLQKQLAEQKAADDSEKLDELAVRLTAGPMAGAAAANTINKRPTKRKENLDEVAVARNALAFSTMDEHILVKEQEQIELFKQRDATLARLRAGTSHAVIKAAASDKRRRLVAGMRTQTMDQADALELANEMTNGQ
jgi:TATA-box binding protein (TBP) (component of TFIID and TFIIIB)